MTDSQIDYIAFYQEHVNGVLKHAGKDEYKGHCPFPENHHGGMDKHPSFSINSKTGQYQCFSCGAKGNQVSFCKAKKIPIPGQQKGKWKEPEAVFDYHDENGVLLYQVCRFPGKKFRQRRPDGKGGWIWSTKDIRKIPYRLQELIESNPSRWVFIPEGEKHVDRLYSLGQISTCNIGGAEKWTDNLNPHLKGRKVCILPDNDKPGHRHGQKVAKSLHRIAKEIRIVNLPGLSPKGDIIDYLNAKGSIEDLLKLLENTPPWKPDENDEKSNEKLIDELNQKHAVVMLSGKCVVLNETWNYELSRPDITFSSPTDFKNFYSNRRTSDGRKLGNSWFDHPRRLQYKGITFAPLQKTPDFFNLWRGFSVNPKDNLTLCTPYLDHLAQNVSNADKELYNYLIAWMANGIQHPCDRPGTSIVLRGNQGTGKGIAISEYGKLFGSHYIHLRHAKHLTGNFNAHLKDALLVFADEAFWAGDKSAEGVLKGMITEEYIQIEPKGKDPFQVKNHVRLMISSNHSWVVPAGLKERRFLIIDMGENCIQNHEYFQNIVECMNDGGREALLYFLQHYDLSKIDLRKIPQTEALMETKILSMSQVEQFWLNCLREGKQTKGVNGWNSANITKSEFYAEFVNFCGKRSYIPTPIEFGLALKKLVPNLDDKRITIDSNRPRCYVFPSLEKCRNYWEKLTNFKGYNWENTEEQEFLF